MTRKAFWVLVTVGLVVGGGVSSAGAASKIFFTATPPTGDRDVYSMNPDGSDVTNLTNAPLFADRHPAVSPDGSRVAFHRSVNGNGNIYVMEIDGTNVTQVTDYTALGLTFIDDDIEWSPELPAQVAAISDGGTYALVFMMGVLAALMLKRQRAD